MFSRLEVKDPRERTQRSQRFPGDTKMAIAVKTSLFIYFFKRRTAWDGKPHFVNTHVKLSSCRVFKASELRTLFRFSIRYKVSVELDSFFQTFYIEYSVSYSYIFFLLLRIIKTCETYDDVTASVPHLLNNTLRGFHRKRAKTVSCTWVKHWNICLLHRPCAESRLSSAEISRRRSAEIIGVTRVFFFFCCFFLFLKTIC